MDLVAFLQQHMLLFYTYVVIIGLLVGSFLNVVIHRLPKMLKISWRSQCEELLHPAEDNNPVAEPAPPYNLVVPRSHCPKCKHQISALENIPILSFALQRGKCKHCGTAIPWRYPIIEAVTGLMSLLVALQFGVSWETTAALILTWSLVALSVIDFDHQLLPDNITLPILWLGILIAFGGLFTDLKSSIIGAVAGYLSLWSIYWLFKLLTKKEGMGYGDFKLLALFGAWLGWQLLPVIILLSSFVGALVGISLILFRGRDRNIPIPFGPYLAAAGWLALFWGQEITNAYLRLSGMNG